MEKWIRPRFQPGIPLGADGRRVTAGKEHIALSRRAAREGMVLLKNEGQVLPLQRGCRVALFGKATIDYVKGGGGSGDVTVPYVRNLYDGFCELIGKEGRNRPSRKNCWRRQELLRIPPSFPSAGFPERAGTESLRGQGSPERSR